MMPSRPLRVVVQQLRAAGLDGAGRTDGELLTQFLSRRDEDALAALVERHAPMVWGVCCRILRNPHDIEDAFQATFLVLVQKAATVVPREMVANWLYGVAQQTAVRLRALAAKRGWREVQMNEMPEPAVADARDEELLALLDQELSRLPERFRALIVLCDLEGHTRKDVARQLGCPEGTVASGLARARELLAKRLTRRGLAVSGGSLAATLSQCVASADVPRTVVTSAINVATLLAAGKAAGVISGPVATLTQGVLKTMLLKKIMTTAVAVLALGAAVIAAGNLAGGQTEGTGKFMVEKDVKPPVGEKPVEPAAKQEKAKKDADVAWGKEENGLQLGLALVPPDRTAYRPGETIEFGVRVRNVSKEKITIQYGRPGSTPTITDAKGEKVHVAMPLIDNFDIIEIPTALSLRPDETAELFKRTVSVREVQKGKVESKGVVNTPTIRVGAGKYKIAFPEMVQRNLVPTTPVLTPLLLTTGEVEFEVKEGGEKELPGKMGTFTAWGKEVGGLQAGVAVEPGDVREYKPGDRVAFEVKLRNVGKDAVTITYCVPHEHAPEITDSQGRQVRVTMPPIWLYYAVPTERVVKSGETMTLFKNEVALGAEVLEPQKDPIAPVSTPTIRVGPGRYKIAIGGMVRSHPKLATGSADFVVKKDEPAELKGEVAWGKEVNGVQIGIQLGKRRVYQVGETVTLILRLRNNGKEVVPFRDDAEYFYKNPPHITDADGKAVTIQAMSIFGFIRGRSVAPGKEVDLIQLKLALRPATDREKNTAWTLYGTGKFHVQYQDVPVVGEVRLGAPGMTLTTGKLDLEVQEVPAEQQKPLTPEEATRMKEGSKLTVEFKVESVTKAVLIKSEAKQEGWIAGHGPDDRCLRPEYPKDKMKARFLSILTPNAIGQLNKAGIRDIEKHFSGKTVRVTGSIVRWDYDGYGTASEVEIVVNDLSQLEVVN